MKTPAIFMIAEGCYIYTRQSEGVELSMAQELCCHLIGAPDKIC